MCFSRHIAGLFLSVMLSLFDNSGLFAQQWQIERLPESINSLHFNEVAPVMNADGSKLFFTRVGSPDFVRYLPDAGQDLSATLTEPVYWASLCDIFTEVSGEYVTDPIGNALNQDIWVATMDGEQVSAIEHPREPLNNAFPNSICARTPDENEFICINQFPIDGGMRHGFSKATLLPNNRWSPPTPIIIDAYYSNQIGLTLTLSSDGNIMIMSLDRQDGLGDTDLYVCFKTGEWHWSKPVNLGPIINTKGRELTPALSADNKRLYFAANREDAEGGTDIYYANRLNDSWLDWSEPRRFIDPINSVADEIQPFFHPLTGHLYFCSNRGGTHDIYRIQIAEPQLKKEDDPQAAVVAKIEKASAPDALPMQRCIVTVRHAVTDELLPLPVVFEVDKTNRVPIKNKNGETGTQFELSPNMVAVVHLKDPNYIAMPIVVRYNELESLQNIVLKADLAKKGTQLRLETVFFERTTARVLPQSTDELDRLVLLLKENPQMNIRIHGHTDNNGRPVDLIALSKRRAEAVRLYLIQQGILPDRLETEGFGGDKPIASNDSEATRKQNRRVEFMITAIK